MLYMYVKWIICYLKSKYFKYFSGSSPFLLAVSIKLKIMPLALAPAKLCEKSQLRLPITSDFTARSALLLDSSK